MNFRTKTGIVLAGYAMAFAAAVIVVHLRIRPSAGMADAQGGMQAFGDALMFIFVFGAVALLPTGLALHYLRPLQKFWRTLTRGALALAATALVAAIVVVLSKQPQLQAALTLPAVFAVLRLLLSPVAGPALIVCTFFAPDTRSRRFLGIAAAIECAAGAAWIISLVASNLR
jgi:hypothetical protein